MDLPGEYSISASFNVSDLSPFDAGDDLRANPSQEEGNDGIVSKDAREEDGFQVPVGPITRARAKRFKSELNNLIIKLQHEVKDKCAKEDIQENKSPTLVLVIRAEDESF